MELLFIFIPFAIAAIFGKKFIYDPFASGKRPIDKLKYPTLARTQRVLRARNVKAREAEARAIEQSYHRQDQKALDAIEKKTAENVTESRRKHSSELLAWNADFKAITAEEDSRKAKEAYKQALAKKQAEEDAWQERRDRERAIWLEAEQKRLAAQPKDIATPNDLKVFQEAYDNVIMNAQGEAIWSRGERKPDTSSYGDRSIYVHAAYVRMKPTKNSKIIGNLTQHEKLAVDGWTTGEILNGNPIWFHIKPGSINGLAGWIWGGALNTQSTSGLKRIDPVDEPGTRFGMITASHLTANMITADKLAVTGAKFDTGSGVTFDATSFQFKNADLDRAAEQLQRDLMWKLNKR